jgi:hypothetical protein
MNPSGLENIAIQGSGGIAGVAAAGPMDLTHVSVEGFDTGVIVTKEGDLKARDVAARRNRIGVDNRGRLDMTDVTFE